MNGVRDPSNPEKLEAQFLEVDKVYLLTLTLQTDHHVLFVPIFLSMKTRYNEYSI